MSPSSELVARGAIAEFVAALEADTDVARALVHREQLPAQPARCAPGLPAAYAHLAPVLTRRGISSLYTHQERALAALERGGQLADRAEVVREPCVDAPEAAAVADGLRERFGFAQPLETS